MFLVSVPILDTILRLFEATTSGNVRSSFTNENGTLRLRRRRRYLTDSNITESGLTEEELALAQDIQTTATETMLFSLDGAVPGNYFFTLLFFLIEIKLKTRQIHPILTLILSKIKIFSKLFEF